MPSGDKADEELEERVAERFELGVDNVEMRHDTMSRDEQIRTQAVHAALSTRALLLVKPEDAVGSVLEHAVQFEHYIRGGATTDQDRDVQVEAVP